MENRLKASLESKNVRASNFELLRIFAMFIIVAHHFSSHSGFKFATDAITVNRLWVQFIQMGGKVGVNIFVLISGYFLIRAERIKTNKIVKLWGQIFFYSIVFFTVFTAAGIREFSWDKLKLSVLPIIFSRWWFASTYFVFYLFVPFLNKFLKSLGKNEYVRFLILMFVCWCIVPTLTKNSFQGNKLLWFVFIYSFAGYLRLFDYKFQKDLKHYVLINFLLVVLTFAVVIVLDVLGTKIPLFASNATFLYDYNRLPVVLIALFTFIIFSKLDIGSKRFINVLSSAMFGVYLIHDHPYVRPFLWKTVFKNRTYAKSNMLIPHSLFAIVTVFVGCTLIELIRIYAIEKRCTKVTNKLANLIDNIKERVCSAKLFNR